MSAAVRVVQHTTDGLLLWVAGGTPIWQVDLPGGKHLRDIPARQRSAGGHPLSAGIWHSSGGLVYQPVAAAHAVWWLYSNDLRFRGWYVNLEHRVHRNENIDVVDHELDVLVAADRTWQWKDEQSFIDKTGQPGYWTSAGHGDPG